MSRLTGNEVQSLMGAYASIYESYGEKKEKDCVDKEDKGKHNCAKKVCHEEFGEGTCIHGQHAVPDRNGFVSHYDVEFAHGIEKGVPVSEMKVLEEGSHNEENHWYAAEGEQIDEAIPGGLMDKAKRDGAERAAAQGAEFKRFADQGGLLGALNRALQSRRDKVAADGGPRGQGNRPVLSNPNRRRGEDRGTSKTAAPAATARPAAPAAPAKPFVKQTGDKAKDMATWAKANPKLAAAAAEKSRIRGTAQTDNPLMKDMRSRMPAGSPTVQSPAVAKLGAGNQSLVNNPNAGKAATPAAKPAPAASATPAAKPAPAAAAPAPVAPKPQLSARAQALKAGGPAGGARERMLKQDVDMFDLVKGFLIDEGATEEEAMMFMVSMTPEEICEIAEGYKEIDAEKHGRMYDRYKKLRKAAMKDAEETGEASGENRKKMGQMQGVISKSAENLRNKQTKDQLTGRG